MDSETSLVPVLFRLIKELRRNYDSEVRLLRIPFARARALSALTLREGCTQAELAAAMGVEAPSLKRQLDFLETDGLIERRGLEGDARKRALHLTDAARALRVTDYMNAIREQLLDGFSDDEQKQLYEWLQRLADNAAAMNRP